MNKLTLSDDLNAWAARARGQAAAVTSGAKFEPVGRVDRVGDGVVMVSGLPETRLNELLVFQSGVHGMVMSLDEDHAGCILLGPEDGISAGGEVHGTGEVARTAVGESLLGRIVDPLGRAIDRGPRIEPTEFREIERPAPGIVERDLVTVPLATGITVIDAMIPLGRGQRELIIGDRRTGKTAIAVDTMINQRDSDVISIYAAIGQKASSVAQTIEAVRTHGRIENCIFVFAPADSAPGAQWLAPYAACSMAEYFVDQGRDVLLVIDDLTKHAATYRQLALLLHYPPGREAYPGDVFYIHSRLLERAARLGKERGGGSLTALPIAETQAGNLAAYIPTNLISITDGQIYLEPKLFNEGLKPAVDVGRSVSRVGGKTQAPAIKHLAETLKLDYAQFQELEIFTRFSATADDRTRRVIEHGRRIRAVLGQPQFRPLPLAEQAALLVALDDGILEKLSLEDVGNFRAALPAQLAKQAAAITARIKATGDLDADDRTALAAILDVLARTFPSHAETADAAPRP